MSNTAARIRARERIRGIDKARRVVKVVEIRALDCNRDQEQSYNIDTTIDPHYKQRQQQHCDCFNANLDFRLSRLRWLNADTVTGHARSAE